MAKRVKNQAQATVPQTEEEVEAAIRRIGELQRLQESLKGEMDGKVAEVKAGYEAPFKQAKNDLEATAQGVQTWCEANRAKITRSGKVKFQRFLAGEVSWRNRPPKVTVRGVKNVMQRLIDLGLSQFIRTKHEIDKEAMLADPERASAIDGVSIGSAGEDFVIKPLETSIEEVV